MAKLVTDVLDFLRQRYSLAIVLEAHTSKGHGIIDPTGTKHWTRWPEFGFNLNEDGIWAAFRLPPDAERSFPTRFVRGNLNVGELPCMPSYSEEDRIFSLDRASSQRHWGPRSGVPGARTARTWVIADTRERMSQETGEPISAGEAKLELKSVFSGGVSKGRFESSSVERRTRDRCERNGRRCSRTSRQRSPRSRPSK